MTKTLPNTKTPNTQQAQPITKPAPRTPETGHAINVHNLEVLIQAIISLGTQYAASNPLYALPHLQQLYTQANTAVNTVINKVAAYQETVDLQTATFLPLKKHATRSKNMFIVSGAPPEAIIRCQHINSNIQGTRIKRIKEEDQHNNHISPAHLSHTQQIKHVETLIELFSTYPQYNPPPDLSIAAWTTTRHAMHASLQAVTVSNIQLKLARINRNATLYKPTTGLIDVALGVKKVVLAIFGTRSPQYRMVSSIEFKRIKGYKNL